MVDKGKLISDLKERMRQVTPLPDEPEFHTSDDTIVRFLKANDWKLKEAEKGLQATLEYRRQTRPLTVDCHWCHDRPGYHSMRQVGHDESGRPVVYANFGQASTRKNTAEDIVTHVTYLIENASASMGNGVTNWVFVIDCSGMTLGACNPKLGYGVSNVLATHYPERLGLVICVNHSSLFHGVWKALKKLLSPGTVSKVKLARTESKISQIFSDYFSDELTQWLLDEINLNSRKPLPTGQREFWNPPQVLGIHNPRGCPSYIQRCLIAAQGAKLTFTPGQPKRRSKHPNIVDAFKSKVVSVPQEDLVDEMADTSGELEALAVYSDESDPSSSEDEGGQGNSPSTKAQSAQATKGKNKRLISRIVRFLKVNDWKLKEAEKGLQATLEYRRQTRPLTMDCHWCHDRPGYHSMVKLARTESKISQILSDYCSDELTQWFLDEINLNSRKPLLTGLSEFWNPPQVPGTHDPQGCLSYIQQCIIPAQGAKPMFTPGQPKRHSLHPNIVDAFKSKVVSVPQEDLINETADTSCELEALAVYSDERPLVFGG